MMPEIALNILDVAENPVRAGAKVVTITVEIDEAADTLGVTIADDGCGMSEEQTAHVTDPFFTTRTTRTVGLGVPFFKQAAELSGGSFSIVSRLGEGTAVHAVFGLRSIDRMPLGDVSGVIHDLVTFHPECLLHLSVQRKGIHHGHAPVPRGAGRRALGHAGGFGLYRCISA